MLSNSFHENTAPVDSSPTFIRISVLLCLAEWHCLEKSLLKISQFSSVAQSCPTLCRPMNRRTPGFPVHHQLLEFTQTHVHRVGDAIQPSHLLSSPSPPAPVAPSIRVFSNESALCRRWPKYKNKWKVAINLHLIYFPFISVCYVLTWEGCF